MISFPLQAEDWTTTTGKTYKNVRVISHDAAYVTILHEDGGGKVLLSTLPADLQKRFGYDPAKAAAALASAKQADKQNEDRLLAEKARIQQQKAAQAEALAASEEQVPDSTRPVYPGSPPTPVPYTYAPDYSGDYGDDSFYGFDGGFVGYPGFGYGRGYGVRSYGIGTMGRTGHFGMAGFGMTHR